MPAACKIEGMRDTNEGALLFQTAERFPRRQPGWDFFGEERGEDFAFCGHNFLADDDPFGGKLLRFQRAGDAVMVGDDDAVDSLAAAGSDQVSGADKGVFGINRVAVKFGAEVHGLILALDGESVKQG